MITILRRQLKIFHEKIWQCTTTKQMIHENPDEKIIVWPMMAIFRKTLSKVVEQSHEDL